MSVTAERDHIRGRPVAHSCTSLETYFLNPPHSPPFLLCFSVPVSRPSLNAFQVDKLLLSLTSLCCGVCVCVCVLTQECFLADSLFSWPKVLSFRCFLCKLRVLGWLEKGGRGTHCYEAVLARRFWEHWIDLHTLPPAGCVSVILSGCCGG